MKERVNAYATLKQPGVRGQVVARSYNQLPLMNRMDFAITLISGELLPGVWDYGYLIHSEDGIAESRLPGEGEGWFKSERDARLYGLGELRRMFEPGSTEVNAIDCEIEKLTTNTLF